MLKLTLRQTLRVPLEAPCIVPDKLAGLTRKQIEELPVQHGNVEAKLGEYFSVAGDASDANVAIEGDTARVKWLGAKMASGTLHIQGPVGMHCGSTMTGGVIKVAGDADDWLGAEMTGGLIDVQGRAGHHAGAAYPGSRAGMRGGALLVRGPTGDGTGAVMRRGLIATGGCGDYAGASMVAGSLFVFGTTGKYAGMAMKRGTIVMSERAELLPTFRPSGVFSPVFMTIYLRRLRELGYETPLIPLPMRRYCGDMAELGLGEILQPA